MANSSAARSDLLGVRFSPRVRWVNVLLCAWVMCACSSGLDRLQEPAVDSSSTTSSTEARSIASDGNGNATRDVSRPGADERSRVAEVFFASDGDRLLAGLRGYPGPVVIDPCSSEFAFDVSESDTEVAIGVFRVAPDGIRGALCFGGGTYDVVLDRPLGDRTLISTNGEPVRFVGSR